MENHAHTTVRRHQAIVKTMALPQPLISWSSTLLDILDHIKNKDWNPSNTYFRFLFFFPFACFFSRVKYFPYLVSSHSLFWCFKVMLIKSEAQHCECTKCHWVVHFKMLNFMYCEFHYNQKKSGTFLTTNIDRSEPINF